MNTVELFCGTKSFSKVAAQLGHSTFTVDSDARHKPDLCINVLALEAKALPFRPDILWASPPCEAFSVAAIGHNWNHTNKTPKSERALVAIKIIEKTLELIGETAPRWWFIENPRGMLRTLSLLAQYPRRTVSYCQYGDMRMKPTDIWTNASWWEPRTICRPNAPCHESAWRGARTGTQGLDGAIRRARIPHPLFTEIFSQLPRRLEESCLV
jgi:hypothetical protein